MTIRDDYDIPRGGTPTAVRTWVLIGVVIVVASGLWLALPNSPVTVAVTAVVVLVLVFGGVWGILSSRSLERSRTGETHRPGPGRAR
jgi:hypothetical protein